MGTYMNKDLTFDGPEPSDDGWPFQLKVALAAVLISVAAWVGAVVGSWLFNYYEPGFIEADYGPVSFVSPAPIQDTFGNTPTIEGLPEPAIDPTVDKVPVSLTRAFDCAYFDCASGAIPVLVDVRYVRLDTTGQQVETFVYLDDFETNYAEGDDYVIGTTKITNFTLTPFTFPEELIRQLTNEGAEFSAWRIEGTSTIDRADSIPASWVSEVFHVSLTLED